MSWATPPDAALHWKEADGLDQTELAQILEAAYLECLAYAPSLSGRTVTDGATTNASTTVTSATASFTSRDVGREITGTGIPVGATIATVTDSCTATLSAAATVTGSGVTLTLGALDVPVSYVLANVYQARDIWTAQQRGDGGTDVVGVGDFVVRARPLSAVVRQLLRPQGSGLLGFA